MEYLIEWKNTGNQPENILIQQEYIYKNLSQQDKENKLIVINVSSAGFHGDNIAKIHINDVPVKMK